MSKFGIVCGSFFISLSISCSNSESNFSSIELSTSGCFGKCPVLDAKIEKNKIYYNFIEHNELKKGSYFLELEANDLDKINQLFYKLKLDSLKNEYSNGIADGQRIKVKILDNNKSKEIFYLNGSAPESLEALVDYIIKLKTSDFLKKSDKPFLISTRKGFEYIMPLVPPNPNEID